MNIIKNIISKVKGISDNKIVIKIIKNSSWLVSEKIFTMIIGVFISAIIARYFGPEKFGQFNYAFAFVSLFTAISTLGLETITVKSIVDKEYNEGTILCTSLVLRIVGGSILTVLSSIIIKLIEPNNQSIHLLVLIMSFTMIVKAFEVIEYWMQAYQRGKVSSIIRMLSYIIISLLKIFLVLFKGTIVQYSIIYTIDAAIIGIALLIAYLKLRDGRSLWKFNFQYAKNTLSQSFYLILSGLLSTIYMRIDQVMLGSMMNSTEVGIYSAAVRISEMWYFVPMALIISFKPVIMNYKKTSEKKYISSLQFLYSIVAWLGIFFGLFILIFSKIIVKILYGQQYLEAGNILLISVWAGTFATLGSARSIWLISENLQKYSIIYIGAGAISNILLNSILIPIAGGYGAAIATLFSQAIATLLVPLTIKETKIFSMMVLKSLNIKKLLKNIINHNSFYK